MWMKRHNNPLNYLQKERVNMFNKVKKELNTIKKEKWVGKVHARV